MSPGLAAFLTVLVVCGLVWFFRNLSAVGTAKTAWSKIQELRGKTPLPTPVIIVAISIVIIVIATMLLMPEVWVVAWGNQKLFWVSVFMILFIVALKTTKGADGKPVHIANKTAGALLWVLIAGVAYQLFYEKGTGLGNPFLAFSKGPNERVIGQENYGPGKIPFEIVHPILSGCESGDGTPGSGKQFVVDKDGKQIPHRNPTKPGVIGYLQINTDDTANAKIIADHKWDVVNKKEDNLAMGEFLYDNYDTVPWTASETCWRPLYDNLRVGLKRYELKIVEAKPREWSEPYRIPSLPPGSKIHTRSIDAAPYYYMANGDDCLVRKSTENFPKEIVAREYAFASKESPTRIRIYYTTP